MNNIKKGFKQKSALRCMADGGAVYREDVNGVPTFTDAKYAGAGATQYTPGLGLAQAPGAPLQPMPQPSVLRPMPPQAPVQPMSGPAPAGFRPPGQNNGFGPKGGYGMPSGVSPLPASAPAAQPKAQMNYMQTSGGFGATGSKQPMSFAETRAPGGAQKLVPPPPSNPYAQARDSVTSQYRQPMASGGKVIGPGGPTDDKVPAMLSAGEYVLPADTVKQVGVQNLDALKSATHTPSGNKATTRSGLRRYADRGFVLPQTAEEIRRAALEAQNRVQKGLPAPGDRWGAQPQTTVNTPTRTPVVKPAPVLDKNFQTPGMQRATVATNAPSGYSTPKPFTPAMTAGRGAVPPGGPQLPTPRAPIQAAVGAAQTANQSAIGAQIDARLAAKGAASAAAPAVEAAAKAAPVAEAAAKQGLGTRAANMLRGGAGKAAGYGGALVGGAAKLITPLTATYAAAQAIGDNNNGYADYRDDGGGVSGHTGRFLETVGNALSFGGAEKGVQGIASLLEGGSFSDGWSLPTRRDEYLANRRDPITNKLPEASGQASAAQADAMPAAAKLTEVAGVPGITKVGPNSYSGVGTPGVTDRGPDPDGADRARQDAMVERNLTSSLRFGGNRGRAPGEMRLNMPDPMQSALRETNKRFDKIASELRSQSFTSGAKRARTLAGIEQARTEAMDAIMGDSTTRRGQDMQQGMNAADNLNAQQIAEMQGQFGLQAADMRGAGKAVDTTKEAISLSKENRALLAQKFPDPEDQAKIARMIDMNKDIVGEGADRDTYAAALLELTNDQIMGIGGLINESYEPDALETYNMLGGGLGAAGTAAVGMIPWVDDNLEGFVDAAGNQGWRPRRKLSPSARSALEYARKQPGIGRERP